MLHQLFTLLQLSMPHLSLLPTMLLLLLPMPQWLLLDTMPVQLDKFPTSQCPSHTRENTEAPHSQRPSELESLLSLTPQTVFMELRLLLLTQLLMLLPIQ